MTGIYFAKSAEELDRIEQRYDFIPAFEDSANREEAWEKARGKVFLNLARDAAMCRERGAFDAADRIAGRLKRNVIRESCSCP